MIANKLILDKYARRFIRQIIDNYHSSDAKASGNTERQLESIIDDNRLQILGPDYLRWMEDGRPPTRNDGDGELVEKIKQWILDKPVPGGNAYAIAKKIHQEGTLLYRTGRHRNIYSDILTPQTIDEMIQEMAFIYGREIESDLIKAFAA